MDEITAAITESIADVAPDTADTSIDTSAGDPPADTTETPSPEAAADTAGEAVEDQPAKPVSRSQQRIQQLANERKALEEKYEAERKAWEAEREKVRWALEDPHARLFYDAHRLADTDPEKYVKDVLFHDERYQGLLALKQAQADAAAASNAAGSDDREPEFPAPDLQYQDGSPAHSPEAIAKYVKDVAAYVAKTTASPYQKEIAELKKALEPVLKEREDTAAYNRNLDKETRAWERTKKVYGLSDADKPEVHAWLKQQWANNRRATLQDAIEEFVVPRIMRERDDARAAQVKAADATHAQTVAARNQDALAAERTPAGAAGKGSGNESMEDVIRAAIANHPDRHR